MTHIESSKIRSKAVVAVSVLSVVVLVLAGVSIAGLLNAAQGFEGAGEALQAAQSANGQFMVFVLVLSLAAALSVAFVAYHFLGFAKGMGRVSDALILASSGDLDRRITHISGSPEVREIQINFNRLLDRTEAFTREATATMKAAGDGRYHRRIEETGMPGDFLKICRKINESIDVMGQKITMFAKVTDDFEANVVAAVKDVSNSAEHIETIASGMSSSLDSSGSRSLDVTEAANEAREHVETVSVAAGELSSSIREIAQQISSSTQITLEAVEEANTANAKIQDLANAAHQIREVVNLINDIAEQTNLLALNATIEAARAGEHGKGFAVVATEVKNLASQVGKATEEISAQISGIQNESTVAVEAIEAITGTIERVNTITNSLSSAVEEQNAATEEIARNVENVLNNMDTVSDRVTKVSRHLIESYGAGIRVLWAAKDIHSPIKLVDEQTSTYLSSARTV